MPTRRQRQNYARILRVRFIHERGLALRSRLLLHRQGDALEASFKKGGFNAVARRIDTDIEPMFRIVSVHQQAGASDMRALRHSMLPRKARKPRSVDERVLSFISQNAAKDSKSISKNSKRMAKDIITRGVASGDSVGKIAKDLSSVMKKAAVGRAGTIARFEVGTAMGFVDQLTAEEEELDIKIWLTANDGGPRHPSAHGLEGQRRETSKAFNVRGHAMMYPMDHAGPLGETMNCRCALEYDFE